jgi:hypothetical protein
MIAVFLVISVAMNIFFLTCHVYAVYLFEQQKKDPDIRPYDPRWSSGNKEYVQNISSKQSNDYSLIQEI